MADEDKNKKKITIHYRKKGTIGGSLYRQVLLLNCYRSAENNNTVLMLSLDQPAVLDSDVNATILGPNQSCKMGLFKNHK